MVRSSKIRGLLLSVIAAVLFAGSAAVVAQEDIGERAKKGDEILLGGATTIFDQSSQAFTFPATGLTAKGLQQHKNGDADFGAIFVSSPSPVNPGLGPVFNNNACASCHVNDGRGKPDSALTSLLFRVSVPGTSKVGGPRRAKGYGLQLQTRATIGTDPEAGVEISYKEIKGKYGDGTPFSLRKPTYTVVDPSSTLPKKLRLSPRIAPVVIGVGLLEAIPEDEILANADPDDEDGDGISGRPNYVWNNETRRIELGRFGWKAETPTVYQQVSAAYNEDMGVTNPLFPVESSFRQSQYDGITDDPELDFETVDDTTFYVQTLAVPARRSFNKQSRRGQKLFEEAGCSSCHLPAHVTGVHPTRNEKALSNQVIFPYTDLLLHDMGPRLADGRPVFVANGREWRTPPLWGIGLVIVTNGHTNFLHDGRARSLEEAILWHGGEAGAAKEFFRNLKKSDRDALISFLKNL
jgi:CxxC motif-containing protein (DUF1111 family)